jgi:hypothetical protein
MNIPSFTVKEETNGPRAYFHDPDGTVLEFIDLTSYAGTA